MSSAAVLIGVDAYDSAPLTSSVNDALAFRDAIISLGLVQSEDVLLLTAPVRPDSTLATKKNITDCLWRFYTGQLKPDRLYVYFAGHGMMLYDDPTRSLGKTVIVPCDVSDLARDGNNLINVEELVGRFKLAGPTEQFFIIDACRDLPYDEQPQAGMLGWQENRELSNARGQATLYAVSPRGKAQAERGGNGVFTKHLIDALHARGIALEYAAQSDEYFVTVASASQYVQQKVLDGLSSTRLWERKYMVPQLERSDPPLTAIRKVDNVERVQITVHIEPDAAVAGTQVHISRNRAVLEPAWPPLENHAAVLLEPQFHQVLVESSVGTPVDPKVTVDVRVATEVHLKVDIAAAPEAAAAELVVAGPSVQRGGDTVAEATPAPSPELAQWTMSLDRIRAEPGVAGSVLNLLAFLAPEDMPLRLLTDAHAVLSEPLMSALSNPAGAQAAIDPLRRYSLVRSTGDSVFVHRRVQGLVRDGLNDIEKRRWAKASVDVLAAAFPENGEDVRSWANCTRLLPHAFAASDHAETLGVAAETTGRLLSSVALFLNARAQFAAARAAIDRALSMHLGAVGPDHPAVALDHNYRGRILRLQGDLGGARIEYELAARIDESAFGPSHPKVATDLIGLGRVLLESDDLATSQSVHERALTIDRAASPQDDAATARDLVMLGRVLQARNHPAQAVDLYKDGIVRDTRAFGADHPEVATDLVDLASALTDQGDHATARTNLERALAIDERSYGPDHPSVARDLAYLGRVRGLQGDRVEGQKLIERALTIDRVAFVPGHLQTARHERFLEEITDQKHDV